MEKQIRLLIESKRADELIKLIDENVDKEKAANFPELLILAKMFVYEVCDNYEVSNKTLDQLIESIKKILNP